METLVISLPLFLLCNSAKTRSNNEVYIVRNGPVSNVPTWILGISVNIRGFRLRTRERERERERDLGYHHGILSILIYKKSKKRDNDQDIHFVDYVCLDVVLSSEKRQSSNEIRTR
jgi:hypothetical protein